MANTGPCHLRAAKNVTLVVYRYDSYCFKHSVFFFISELPNQNYQILSKELSVEEKIKLDKYLYFDFWRKNDVTDNTVVVNDEGVKRHGRKM